MTYDVQTQRRLKVTFAAFLNISPMSCNPFKMRLVSWNAWNKAYPVLTKCRNASEPI